MKAISLVIMALLITGVFASSVLAEDEEVGTVEQITENTVISGDDVTQTLAEADDAVSDNDAKVIGSKIATAGSGWAVNKNGKSAEIVSGMWITKKYKSSNPKEQNLTENDTEKTSSEVVYSSFGRFYIGLGKEMDKFKLVKKEMKDNSVTFYVLSINDKYLDETEAKTASLGTLTLNKKQYPNMALWTGKIVLNSGKYTGEWSVSLASKTRGYNKELAQKSKEEPKKTAEKVGFWKKLFGKKAKANESAKESA